MKKGDIVFWMILGWFACASVGVYFYAKIDNDKSYDVQSAASDAAKANAKCMGLGEGIDELSAKFEALHNFQIEQGTKIQTTLGSILDDMEKMKARQIILEKRSGGQKTLHLKITEPIPVEIKKFPPKEAPPPLKKRKDPAI